jgi:ATP-dependent DNA helicase RecG
MIELIAHNNRISRKEIALNIGINESAVQKHLNKLKHLKVIERIGRTRGYWQMLIYGS